MAGKTIPVIKQNIGILGGTFDPVHLGHLILAQEVMLKCGLDGILFMPSGTPPHKPEGSVSPKSHRLKMLKLALDGYKQFMISDMEIKRPGLTYTIDTMAELTEKYASTTDFFYIIGADNIRELVNWKNHADLLRSTGFIAACRPGFDDKESEVEARRLTEVYGAKIEFVETPAIEISSTQIRERAASGLPISFMVPRKVEDYILAKKLYRNTVDTEVD